ncbi:MAG: phytoene desaturase [Acidobacteria bacterium]|nr:phytoene desaturase [Acidobacteriota bacterium]NIM63897.1 phytoene desaturase [Acidobacteriota bacterium]NIO60166.1 phytoene desaturase [Acidobacteriota bacterium]NIQ31230.1 phytoene desaturase [Acidobacteriota bacterium]NIQ86367.1 phytoene desaturase [Acidobacteriota bacterium]
MGRPRAAVIGSGFGGLTLAVRLQAAGVATTLVEKRDRPGGRAYVFHDKGFAFDGGPTVITAPECLADVFRAAGREMEEYVELLPVMPFYRLHWEDGYRFDYSNDLEAVNAQIEAKSPRDVDGYARFRRYADDVFKEGYVKLANVPFLDFWSMIRVAPQLTRLQAFRSVYSMVARFIKDDHLRQVLSFHSLLVGGNPFASSSIYTLIHALERRWGVSFVRGGTGALVDAYVQLFRELGGELRLECPVERIRTTNGRVSGIDAADGWSEDFDLVASNADVVHTYSKLLRDEPLAARRAAGVARRRHSMSLFVIYFGARRQPGMAHHSVLFGPRYRELLSDIFDRGNLADDFSLYLHAPTVTDPTIAPDGYEAFYVLSPVPHLGKAEIDWSVEGPRYRDRILDYLHRRYLPVLSESPVTLRIFTPHDFRDVLNTHHGSAFSLEPILSQSAYFRVHNRDDRIGGLYFVGAGTHPGAGVPGVVNSAEATAGLILEDLGMARTRSVS